MIIVSQDKYNILNFDTTVNIGIEEITTLSDIVQISAQTNGNTIILGKYKTEKKAKEILQEIINVISLKELKNKTYEEAQLLINFRKIARYEMPER